jgi:TolB-like protein
MVPSRDEATAQLERVLASDVFATATRLSRFLRFVSERSLAGESERLKEYVIGVEVFDRDERYDPRVDSIVRVEAGRLRTKLEQYYNGPGRDDGIVIRLQKGGYAPSFERRAADAPLHDTRSAGALTGAAAPPDAQSAGDTDESQGAVVSPTRLAPSRRAFYFAAAVVVLGIAVALIAPRLRSGAPPADAVAVLPFEISTGSPEDKAAAVRLTEGVTAELVRTGRFSVVPSRDAREIGSEGSAQSIARRLQASWLLEARVTHAPGTVRIEARMMNAARNRKLWVDSFEGSPSELDDLSRRVGAAAATALDEHQAGAAGAVRSR